MRITATKCKGKDLKVGELFSTADQLYWDGRDKMSIGERVYIRTEAPTTPGSGPNDDIFRITIEVGVPQVPHRTEGIASAEAFGQGGSITVGRKEEYGIDND